RGGVRRGPGPARVGFAGEVGPRLRAAYPGTAGGGAEIFTDYERHFEEALALVITGIGTAYGLD
ncbi:TetR family transcriptional regulator, partial [Streptomyces parvulus]